MTEGGQQQPSLAAPSQVSSTASAGLRIKPKQGRAIMFWYTPPGETWNVASLGPGPAAHMAAKQQSCFTQHETLPACLSQKAFVTAFRKEAYA